LPLATGNKESDMQKLRRGGEGVELKYRNFSVVMSASRRLPMITACNILSGDSRKEARINVWSFDGRLDNEDQWGDEIYDNNILDRGHMVRREDPIWGEYSSEANLDTFHFTNSCPQVAGVNQKTWLGLENYILSHAREDEMSVSVFTGPFFDNNDLQYKGALIPAAFWKVIAFLKDDGTPSATAYRVSQEKELSELEFVYGAYKTFQISINSVAEQTGIDFGELASYDGFSQLETVNGGRVAFKLENLNDIRI
jgi:endonuclease G